jgi:hypothetical protein
MENPYDVTDSERMERDWQQEEQAQSRFLEETYNWIPVCGEAGTPASGPMRSLPCGEQLNLFDAPGVEVE